MLVVFYVYTTHLDYHWIVRSVTRGTGNRAQRFASRIPIERLRLLGTLNNADEAADLIPITTRFPLYGDITTKMASVPPTDPASEPSKQPEATKGSAEQHQSDTEIQLVSSLAKLQKLEATVSPAHIFAIPHLTYRRFTNSALSSQPASWPLWRR